VFIDNTVVNREHLWVRPQRIFSQDVQSTVRFPKLTSRAGEKVTPWLTCAKY